MARQLKRVSSPESLTPLHTCTAISRLINCESCSLETLNHSFSVLSRAASLTTLTRVPPCLPNTGDSGGGGREGGDLGGVVRYCTAGIKFGLWGWKENVSERSKITPGCHYKCMAALSPISVIADCRSLCCVKRNLSIQTVWIITGGLDMRVLGILEVNQSLPLYRYPPWTHVHPDTSFFVLHKFHTVINYIHSFLSSKPSSPLQGKMARNSQYSTAKVAWTSWMTSVCQASSQPQTELLNILQGSYYSCLHRSSIISKCVYLGRTVTFACFP